MTAEEIIFIATIIIAVAAAFSAVSAIASVVVTKRLAEDNRILRKVGTEPEVVVFLRIDPRHWAINFVLANVGQGPARDVEVRFQADAADFLLHRVSFQTGDYRKLATILPQGERYEMFFGGSTELFHEPILQPFEVSIRYRDLADQLTEKVHLLDVSIFEWHSFVREPSVAKSLSEIQKDIRKISKWGKGGPP